MTGTFVSFHGETHVGKTRPENQDRFLTKVLTTDKVLLAIADGMGGASAGGLAATSAMDVLENQVNESCSKPEDIVRVIKKASEQIIAFSSKNGGVEGMGTTMTAVQVGNGLAIWAHVGDSRLYHLHGGQLIQVSRDHRFLQDLLDAGDVTPEEALVHPLRGYLDQCVGSPDVQPDCGSFPVAKGDLLLLTTDGLHDHVPSQKMLAGLDSSLDLTTIADMLIKEAVESGSADDVSIVLGRVDHI